MVNDSSVAPEILTITLHDLAHGGEAVGRHENQTVFVPRGIPGEVVRVEVVRRRKRYVNARLLEVLQPSPNRVEPPCPYFGPCGGCQLQHIQPAQQAELKRRIVQTVLRRIGGFADALVHPTIAAPAPYVYRNHARFSSDRDGRLGFMSAQTNSFLPIAYCYLMAPEINYVLAEMQGKAFGLHQLAVRYGFRTSSLMVTPDVSSRTAAIPSGQRTLDEELLGRRFQMHGPSFFQVNTRPVERNLPDQMAAPWLGTRQVDYSQAEMLILTVLDKLTLTGSETVVDAYCGVGTFALLLAPRCRSVIGIEEASIAIDDARLNAECHGVSNVRFLVGRTERVLSEIEEHVDAVILDPARVGLHPNVIVALAKLQPRQIIYVSCEPSTLARDLKRICEFGYQLMDVQPVDMFPQTYHIEVVATLHLAD